MYLYKHMHIYVYCTFYWWKECVMGFPGGSAGKESTCSVGDLGSIPRLGRSLGEGNGYPLQYSGLENSMDSMCVCVCVCVCVYTHTHIYVYCTFYWYKGCITYNFFRKLDLFYQVQSMLGIIESLLYTECLVIVCCALFWKPRWHIKKQRHYFANKGPSSQGCGFSISHICMWELDYKESWAPKNWCFWSVVLEKTLESPLDCKEIQPVHLKGDQSWVFIGRTDVEAETPNILATWCEELTHQKRPWCWERLKVGGKGDDRGWDGWMASPTQWRWVWVNRSWWWTGRPGVLQSMGSQRVGHNWATELNWFWNHVSNRNAFEDRYFCRGPLTWIVQGLN